jgi:hypothetical protein
LAGFIESGEKFQIGSVLSCTWLALWTQPGMFFGLTLLSLVIPMLLGGALGRVLAAAGIVFSGPAARIVPALVTFLLVAMFMLLFQGAITYAVFQIFMEGRASVTESLERSFSRVIDLLLAMFWAALITGGIIILILLPFAIIAAFGIINSFITLIFTIAAILTPSVLFCRWYVVAPVCVVERTGSLQSLRRSGYLTKGRCLKIYGLLTLVMIIIGIISVVVNFIIIRTIDAEWIRRLISTVFNVVPIAFANVMSTVVYYGLRVEKEDLTATTLADIFD